MQKTNTVSQGATCSLLKHDPRAIPPLAEIFDNGNPVEMEIGCGKGKFIIARAQEHPEINFLGVDVVWKWMKYAVQRSDKRELHNIRFIKCDVRDLLKHGIAQGSVDVFHVYFPDPWPKRRHRKRRLITGDFLRMLHNRLTDNGLIELATDYEDYFLQMRLAIMQSGLDWRKVEERTNERLFNAHAKTNYELKYELAGRTLHYFELAK
jgi:tRNA (guanine-N7-)-methyltransferase